MRFFAVFFGFFVLNCAVFFGFFVLNCAVFCVVLPLLCGYLLLSRSSLRFFASIMLTKKIMPTSTTSPTRIHTL